MSRGPPQLMFDDGSRVMAEDSERAAAILDRDETTTSSLPSLRGSIPLHSYYEIDRMSREVIGLFQESKNKNKNKNDDEKQSILRVALQFPDELLQDSPEVCWLLEDQIRQDGCSSRNVLNPFCFVLGDTTVNACCPDEVAAHHLNADVLIHYGHACLSPTESLPVLYSFGKLEFDNVDAAVETLETARNKDGQTNFLVLYQVGYHHAMVELQKEWSEKDDNLNIVVAEIPTLTKPLQRKSISLLASSSCCRQPDASISDSGCCGGTSSMPETNCGEATSSSSCCQEEKVSSCSAPIVSPPSSAVNIPNESRNDNANTSKPLMVGGLELPSDKISSWEDLLDYTVVFIMGNPQDDADNYSADDVTTPQQRQYANSMFCFLSLPHGEPNGGYWIYSPLHKELRTDVSPSPALKRQLKRRFFLTQKAKDANVFGILVSNLSQQHLVDVVKSLQTLIQDANRTAYSFAVGKINPAKLANFAEIETFVIVACRENSLLDNEREYPIPVITPMELEIALDHKQWGMQAYSLDCQDVMLREQEGLETNDTNDNDDDSVDSDAPYFSMVTGRYESRKQKGSGTQDVDLQALPGRGQVTEYKSEAANFLRQREYQGLESKMGQTEVKTAVLGMRGIASEYRPESAIEEDI